ncbi:DUF1461 domain-containing protein [Marinimicrobium sp. ABcell2]|uniref:lipoprotein intramolecular transacylase Lit n=1 Tax=Marinimicrobium sp. ABcell2 TaxID=3069751 RepID=UPI0027B7FA05|nr:DUF1461 domain-containing protein [Marinimicrobium sp. ABcell2]MDQ2075195.1 DUF1461 domain-containing protein [Marinimicrobium sp. ABcell2]
MSRLFDRYLLWPLLLIGHLLAMSLLAWHLLAQVNFGYPVGYQVLDIHGHIQTYAPQNHYKDHFELTSSDEHKRLFAEITRAIQRGGEGLAEISYTLPSGEQTPMMREPEVVHLQDVANLVRDFYRVGIAGGLILLGTLIYAYHRRLRLPPTRKLLSGFAMAIAAIAILVLAIGPLRVFYGLHDYAFPDDNPWFFYYQDSLMTTMMKAPDLFGFITLLLVAVFALLWGLSAWGMARLLRYRALKR